MYAIIKTGGKQYKVAAGDFLNVEKLDAEVGSTVALDAIAIVDGKNVVADPAEAAKTKVEAKVVEQFKGEKQLVFKFKKRKNYKKMRGHRQNLTRIQICAVGSGASVSKGGNIHGTQERSRFHPQRSRFPVQASWLQALCR